VQNFFNNSTRIGKKELSHQVKRKKTNGYSKENESDCRALRLKEASTQ